MEKQEPPSLKSVSVQGKLGNAMHEFVVIHYQDLPRRPLRPIVLRPFGGEYQWFFIGMHTRLSPSTIQTVSHRYTEARPSSRTGHQAKRST
jgi:hypothetical protein